MKVYEHVAHTLWHLGVRQVFGVAGSGNYRVTRELIRSGAHYIGARHEGGAVSMADAFSRMHETVPVVSVHQGGGLTNLVTGLTEAAKSHTPMLILAGEAPLANRVSNFRIDQEGLVEAVGARAIRISHHNAGVNVAEAYRMAVAERVPVLLNFPVDVQMMDAINTDLPAPLPLPTPLVPDAAAVEHVVELLLDAQAPLLLAGRGARGAGANLRALGEKAGAILATSAVAHGLFTDDPFSVGVMGDLATPIATEMVMRSDLIIAFGCSLSNWTTANGELLPKTATLVQIDDVPLQVAFQRPVDFGMVADTALAADAIAAQIPDMEELRSRRRTPATKERIAAGVRWQDVEYKDISSDTHIDPRTATIELDKILEREKNVAIDSGNFLGYPSMFLTIPDEQALCFSQAFQCVGLGLASAIGHATARPDRLTVCGTGDGGLLMAASELETVARLGLPMVIVVYNDSAYGAEVHHFGRQEEDDGFVSFADVDFASIAHGYGLDGVTVRTVDDFAAVREWAAGPRERAIVIDLKVTISQPSWWLAEAFKAEAKP